MTKEVQVLSLAILAREALSILDKTVPQEIVIREFDDIVNLEVYLPGGKESFDWFSVRLKAGIEQMLKEHPDVNPRGVLPHNEKYYTECYKGLCVNVTKENDKAVFSFPRRSR